MTFWDSIVSTPVSIASSPTCHTTSIGNRRVAGGMHRIISGRPNIDGAWSQLALSCALRDRHFVKSWRSSIGKSL